MKHALYQTMCLFLPLYTLLGSTFLNNAFAQNQQPPFNIETVTNVDEAWAMTFMPDGRLLITEKFGKLSIVTQQGKKTPVSGVPDVDYGGQGGLGDVILHPNFSQNNIIYLSYVEGGDDNVRGAAVARAALHLDKKGGGSLSNLNIIWRQSPKTTGLGHYGHRLAFSPDGHLFISSGERQKFHPAQDMKQNLGKIIRLNADGSIPNGNPFTQHGTLAQQIWTLGHRNPLGLVFDQQGKLWSHEMGPMGGDELNLILRGKNYGYPTVSDGDHYSGDDIPDHSTRAQFETPKISWSPVISPSGFIIYTGNQFPQWKGNGFIGGLSSRSLVRVVFEGNTAKEVERFNMKKRIREVEQGPNGAIWLLEDKSGRLLKLTPKST